MHIYIHVYKYTFTYRYTKDLGVVNLKRTGEIENMCARARVRE